MNKGNKRKPSPVDYSEPTNKRLSATVKLYDALVAIRDMPDRDQDDALRLRHIASTAIDGYLSGDIPSFEKNKIILSRMKIGETKFVGKVTRQNFLQAAKRLGIDLATRQTPEGLYVWRVK